jgi:hypothetical protein
MNRFKFLKVLLIPAFVFPLVFGVSGCDDAEDDDNGTAGDGDGDGNGDGDGDGDGDAQGECGAAFAGMACDPDCSFDPTGIDCNAACTNVATVCANNECDEQCTGVNQDVAQCTIACEATKGMYCSNVVFGCYAQNDECTAVGTCVNANL